MNDCYLTIANSAEGLYKEKGSKFLAYIYEIASEEDAIEIVSDFKKRYHDARHHCYAYQLGVEGDKFRENDDGEPSGTAGKPIRGQIRSKGITNVLIVVVRYFGGTKLGVSGLINAYKSAALDAIENAVIVEKRVEREIEFSFGYLEMNDVMKLLKDMDCRIISQHFDNLSRFKISIRLSHADRFVEALKKIDGVDLIE